MRVISVRNATRNIELGQTVRVASSLIERAVGLLSTPPLGDGEGLYLKPCAGIHTFFMRYPIDVLFLDSAGKVVGQGTYKPWRFSRFYPRSKGAVELREGVLVRSGTRVGDQIEMKDRN